MAIGFSTGIKPYFTACYRERVQCIFDLWSPADVQTNWQDIHDRLNDGSMPKAGCPEIVWDAARTKFLSDLRIGKTALPTLRLFCRSSAAGIGRGTGLASRCGRRRILF